MRTCLLPFLLIASAGFAASAYADDYVIVLNDHQFSPQTLVLPAGQKIKLTVKNRQSTPAEFESSELDREKLVGAGSEVVVNLGPLDAGKYTFFDDFHRETTGVILVK